MPGDIRRIRAALCADLGIAAGLALYFLLEFASTGSFGFQRSSYASPAETKAAVLLGIGAGVAAAGWLFLHPIGRLLAPRAPQDSMEPEPPPVDPTGLDGKEPSPRSLAFLVLGELRTYFMAALGFLTLAGLLAMTVVGYVPQVFPYLIPAAIAAFCVYVWSRVRRLQGLCRTGAEVEGRLLKVDTDQDGEKTARYRYEYRGAPHEISNSSWWLRSLALRHGERIIVLLDQRHPDDAVILGRYPSADDRVSAALGQP